MGIIYCFVRVCHFMVGHGILKYFRPITGKKGTSEDKNPPKGKELPNPSRPLSKVVPLSSIATCNAEVLNQGAEQLSETVCC